MTTQPPTLPDAIPAPIQAMISDIERMARMHPALFAYATSLRLGDECLTIRWSKFKATQADMRALVCLYPTANWKQKPGHVGREIDYVATIDGVKVELECADNVPLERLPEEIDIEAILVQQMKQQPTQWFCPNCNKHVEPPEVTFDECHDPKTGGCGHKVQ